MRNMFLKKILQIHDKKPVDGVNARIYCQLIIISRRTLYAHSVSKLGLQKKELASIPVSSE